MNWAERSESVSKSIDYDSLTTIPMLELGSEPKREMVSRIRKAFDFKEALNIVIIDPYLEPQDLELIVELFASLNGRSIEIITNLENTTEQTKKEIEKKISPLRARIINQHIFANFTILKTNVGIHDRYIFSRDDACASLFFSLGGSLNMLFKKHSSILRIVNTTFRYQLINLAERCKGNAYEIK